MGFLLNPYRYGAGAYSGTLLTDLVGWWSMDETSGDRVNNHNPGTYNMIDTNTVGYAAGKVGNAAQFTAGDSDRLDAAISGAVGDFTIAYWFYFANVTTTQWTIDVATSIDQYVSGGKLYNRFLAMTNTHAVSVDTWYNVIMTNDQGTAAFLYLNNSQVDSSTLSNCPDWVSLRLGARRSLGGFSSGRMDEVAYWSRVLTSDERAEFYNSGTGMAYPG